MCLAVWSLYWTVATSFLWITSNVSGSAVIVLECGHKFSLDERHATDMWPLECGRWSVALECGHWNWATGVWPLECGHWNWATGVWPLECGH